MPEAETKPKSLFLAVLIRYIFVVAILGLLFFGTAGSLAYLNAWVYLATIIVTLGIGFVVLFRKDKSLLRKRIGAKETEKRQKVFVAVSSVLIIALYALPGLDFRFSWSRMPASCIVLGEALLIAGYAGNLAVMLANSFASRTVEIQESQKVIDSGPYSIVRHPMYSSMILIYLGTCLILGSYFAFIPCALLFIMLGFRAVHEEMVLKEGLAGYEEYSRKVKYRMLPFVW